MRSFNTLGPTPPYPITSGNTFAIGDFDGDGRVEAASYCPANNTFNMLTYFAWSDVPNIPGSPSWPAGSGGAMINGGCCSTAIPAGQGVSAGWILQPNDQFYSLKLSAQSPGYSLVAFNPTSLNFGLIQWVNGQMELVWMSAAGQAAAGVELSSQDKFVVQDVDRDSADELVLFSPGDLYLITLKWIGQSFSYIQSVNSKSGWSWTMSGSDVYLKANVPACGGGNLIVISQGSPECAILSLNSGQYTCTVCTVPSGYDPASKNFDVGVFRNLSPAPSTLLTADADGDGTDELIGINPGGITEPPIVLKWNAAGAFQPMIPLNEYPNFVNTGGPVYGAMPQTNGPALTLSCNQTSAQLSVQTVANSALQTLWTG